MQSDDFHRSLPSLFSELVFGARESEAFVLNPGDRGLLDSLRRITAEQASTIHESSSVAAHIRHLEYGLSLMNRWADGEDPFGDANWSASWRETGVTPAEWDSLRDSFADTCTKWHANLMSDRTVTGIELDGVIGSVIHLGYHLGAIRQMNVALRGPAAND